MQSSPSLVLDREGVCVGDSTFSQEKVGDWRFAGECRFLLNTQLKFLKKEKDPTTKQLDDDEWIRSLTEAQEVTTDVPEDSVTHEQQEVDPQKVWPIEMGETLRKYFSRRLWPSVREKLQP